MTDGGWTRTPRTVWHAAVAGIVGPWPKEVREHDLLVWDELRAYEGAVRPSGRELAARWGVSHAVARRDIERHEGRAQRGHTTSTERAHQEHKGGTLGAHPSQVDPQQPEEKGTDRAQRGHTTSTERAHQEHKGGTPPPNDAGELLLFQALEKEKETETREGEQKASTGASAGRPTWWRATNWPKGVDAEALCAVVKRTSEACRQSRGRGAYPAKGDVAAAVGLYNAAGYSDLATFEADLLLVADAGHHCPHERFAGAIRQEWKADGKGGYQHQYDTLCRIGTWEDKLATAKQWDAKGRPKATKGATGRKEIVNTPMRNITREESDDELRALGIDPDEIPF